MGRVFLLGLFPLQDTAYDQSDDPRNFYYTPKCGVFYKRKPKNGFLFKVGFTRNRVPAIVRPAVATSAMVNTSKGAKFMAFRRGSRSSRQGKPPTESASQPEVKDEANEFDAGLVPPTRAEREVTQMLERKRVREQQQQKLLEEREQRKKHVRQCRKDQRREQQNRQRQRKAPKIHVPKRAPDPRLAITGEPTQTLVPLDKLHRKVEIKQPRPKREPLPVVTNEELQELAANNPPPPEWLEEASEFTPNQGR